MLLKCILLNFFFLEQVDWFEYARIVYKEPKLPFTEHQKTVAVATNEWQLSHSMCVWHEISTQAT